VKAVAGAILVLAAAILAAGGGVVCVFGRFDWTGLGIAELVVGGVIGLVGLGIANQGLHEMKPPKGE